VISPVLREPPGPSGRATPIARPAEPGRQDVVAMSPMCPKTLRPVTKKPNPPPPDEGEGGEGAQSEGGGESEGGGGE
jgi:hypothetical protein